VLTSQTTDHTRDSSCRKRKDKLPTIATIPIDSQPLEHLLTKEWLLTNTRGSYASSTVVGCNTRRYHGLLIGSLNPPANRIMALAQCLEMVIIDQHVLNLTTFEFTDKFAPQGFTFLKQFRRDTGVHFDYQLDGLTLTKSIYLLRDTDTVALAYSFIAVHKPAEFVLRPLVALRDFHSLQKSQVRLCSTPSGDSVSVRYDMPNSCELFLNCPATHFEKDEQWWFNFVYRNERQRGQDFTEDLWTPGFFKCRIDTPAEIILWANLSGGRRLIPTYTDKKASSGRSPATPAVKFPDIETVRQDLRARQDSIAGAAKTRDVRFRTLLLAADQFITKRPPLLSCESKKGGHALRTTIIAGFPWFSDWGRDTFIALPGLLLATRRFDEAKSVLTTFAQAADEGMIPNRFDDYSGTAYFNSVDASLWFINAAFQYLSASGDSKTFTQQLLPIIRWIVDSYQKGTRFDIHVCSDGLITAGNEESQLTWMDAKYDGIAFTPRYGRAVEVNALWYNSLRCLAEYYADQSFPFSRHSQHRCEVSRGGSVPRRTPYGARNAETAEHYKDMADKARGSFCGLFWNEKLGHLNDTIGPDDSADSTLRPNQILAVSLAFSPLSLQQQKSVVDTVQKHLLTPYGLRTLSTEDHRYKGTYTGPPQQRDEAYHQGTVWPYLIGAFVEAYLKVNGYSRKSKKKAGEFIKPLLQHLTEDGCIGSVSEIFDGHPPHEPRGCIAQAWSVAELIRAYQLINS